MFRKKSGANSSPPSLHQAVIDHDTERFMKKLKKTSDAFDIVDSVYNRTVVHWMANSGNLACFQQAAEHSKFLLVDLNRSDVDGRSVLHLAIMNYQKPFLTALFEKSSNRIELNQCDKAGKSALYYAIELPDRADSVESTMFLIGKGADVNQICLDQTPLICSLKLGNLECAAYLIDRCNVDVNFVDSLKRSSLMYALSTASMPLIKSLLSAGADPTVHDVNGKSILECARIVDEALSDGHVGAVPAALMDETFSKLIEHALIRWEMRARVKTGSAFAPPDDDALSKQEDAAAIVEISDVTEFEPITIAATDPAIEVSNQPAQFESPSFVYTEITLPSQADPSDSQTQDKRPATDASSLHASTSSPSQKQSPLLEVSLHKQVTSGFVYGNAELSASDDEDTVSSLAADQNLSRDEHIYIQTPSLASRVHGNLQGVSDTSAFFSEVRDTAGDSKIAFLQSNLLVNDDHVLECIEDTSSISTEDGVFDMKDAGEGMIDFESANTRTLGTLAPSSGSTLAKSFSASNTIAPGPTNLSNLPLFMEAQSVNITNITHSFSTSAKHSTILLKDDAFARSRVDITEPIKNTMDGTQNSNEMSNRSISKTNLLINAHQTGNNAVDDSLSLEQKSKASTSAANLSFQSPLSVTIDVEHQEEEQEFFSPLSFQTPTTAGGESLNEAAPFDSPLVENLLPCTVNEPRDRKHIEILNDLNPKLRRAADELKAEPPINDILPLPLSHDVLSLRLSQDVLSLPHECSTETHALSVPKLFAQLEDDLSFLDARLRFHDSRAIVPDSEIIACDDHVTSAGPSPPTSQLATVQCTQHLEEISQLQLALRCVQATHQEELKLRDIDASSLKHQLDTMNVTLENVNEKEKLHLCLKKKYEETNVSSLSTIETLQGRLAELDVRVRPLSCTEQEAKMQQIQDSMREQHLKMVDDIHMDWSLKHETLSASHRTLLIELQRKHAVELDKLSSNHVKELSGVHEMILAKDNEIQDMHEQLAIQNQVLIEKMTSLSEESGLLDAELSHKNDEIRELNRANEIIKDQMQSESLQLCLKLDDEHELLMTAREHNSHLESKLVTEGKTVSEQMIVVRKKDQELLAQKSTMDVMRTTALEQSKSCVLLKQKLADMDANVMLEEKKMLSLTQSIDKQHATIFRLNCENETYQSDISKFACQRETIQSSQPCSSTSGHQPSQFEGDNLNLTLALEAKSLETNRLLSQLQNRETLTQDHEALQQEHRKLHDRCESLSARLLDAQAETIRQNNELLLRQALIDSLSHENPSAAVNNFFSHSFDQLPSTAGDQIHNSSLRTPVYHFDDGEPGARSSNLNPIVEPHQSHIPSTGTLNDEKFRNELLHCFSALRDAIVYQGDTMKASFHAPLLRLISRVVQLDSPAIPSIDKPPRSTHHSYDWSPIAEKIVENFKLRRSVDRARNQFEEDMANGFETQISNYAEEVESLRRQLCQLKYLNDVKSHEVRQLEVEYNASKLKNKC